MSDRVGSEADIIDRYLKPLTASFAGAFGLADDCAVLSPREGEDLVLTMDAVAAGVHFFADDAAADIAWKALAVNVSDLAAKGARPVAYLMSLAFPEAPLHAWLDDFAKGLAAAQAAFGLVLAGGDTDRRPGPLTITITAIGAVPQGRHVVRQDAHLGDLLFVTGTLGNAALGLRLRQDPGRAAAWGLSADQVAVLDSAYLRPQPRVGLAAALLSSASAALDISDGLAKDLGRLCRASGLGAAVSTGALPLSAAAAAVVATDPAEWRTIVAGGDDYEILAAVPPGLALQFAAAAAAAGVDVTEIGVLDGSDGVLIAGPDSRALAADDAGWDHFG